MGGNGESGSGDLRAHEWQLAADYRHIHADQFFFGSQQSTPPAQFFGQPIIIDIHTVNFNVTYGLSDRVILQMTVPVSRGSQSRVYPDTARHVARAGGLGDISLVATRWLLDPRQRTAGNVALGLGVKTPTGRNDVRDHFFFADGSSVVHPVDQSIELGDGGWGVILQAQAFRRVASRSYAYFTGSYLVSPRNQSDVTRAPAGQPNAAVRISVSDVYTARIGLTYGILPEQGLSVSLGGRIDGIPWHDLISGSDGFRRPGYVIFADPAIVLQRGPNTVTVSAPVRSFVRLASRSAITNSGGTLGSGDLAAIVVFVGYARRL